MSKFSFSKTPPPIVLMTDFGIHDHYVGVMKGVIAGICQESSVIDLTHNIDPQDVTAGAFVLSASHTYFPQDTIFTCVIDPGVGTSRDVVCARIDGRTYLAPDNGLLSVVAARADDVRYVAAENEKYMLKDAPGSQTTFDGRDVFASVAAHLADGVSLDKMGTAMPRIKDLELPHPVKTTSGMLTGEIIYVDQFGNLITNISVATLQATFRTSLEHIKVHAGDELIDGVSESYAETEEGELLALISSNGYLEIAANQGSAAEKLGCERGDEVRTSTHG